MKEPFLEPVLRKFRIKKVIDEIIKVPECKLLDVGCGFNHKFLSTVEPYIAHGTGVDFKVPEKISPKIKTICVLLDETLPFANNSFDVVTMLAVLEHLDRPLDLCLDICRVLKPGGRLIVTVPGKKAKPVLEFLAYKVGIVNKKEIEDHKMYYDLAELQNLVKFIEQFKIVKHMHFQLGMNNFCIIKKQCF